MEFLAQVHWQARHSEHRELTVNFIIPRDECENEE